ncbi:T9SS C-terminal target domain-containing protein [Crocinitomix catalasitica]|uniref:T9SS C-terminal target domain-containing protein n=1 Tax=Crocinitomix catalasitica TaxID=184607 RepID=UPI0004897C38|nr:T9SS C-terminal target domain-containing protein [Crocinitomix catalasitica]
MKRILILFSIIATLNVHATHIVGGELSYQHLGGSSYYITVKLYKDCNPGVANFPNDVEVEAITGFGLDTLDFIVLPRLGRDTLSPEIDTCAFDPGVCVEEAIYGGIVSLPPMDGGYHLFYQTYARNGSLVNIEDPLLAGESFYAYVPDNKIFFTNSSPVFSVPPPVFVCQSYDLAVDFSATDSDGDSLAYSFYTPYTGRTFDHPEHYDADFYYPTVDLDGTPPDNITFPEVVWGPGFDADNPLNAIGGVGLTISSDGLISGTPEALGQYVLGVMVEEYRDGEKIGEVVRDFQLNVVSCPPPNDALIGAVDGCSGYDITFTNESGLGASDFWWDFGTGNPADTSLLDEPTFDFSAYAPGIFTITLIAEKGSRCADTAYYELALSIIDADFELLDTACTSQVVEFGNRSTTSVITSIDSYTWDFGDGTTSYEENPNHIYSTPGDYTVQLIVESALGCIDSISKSIHIKSPPGAGIRPIMGCVGLDVDFTNTSAADAENFHWNFGTGIAGDTSNVENPSFTFPDYGEYTITLITQHNTPCSDTVTYVLKVSNATADFVASDTTCADILISFEDLSTSNNGSINSWEWNFGDESFSTDENPTHGYTEPGDYTVQLVVLSDIGCTDTITKEIHIDEVPTPAFETSDLCDGLAVDFTNLSSGDATTFWWDFGTGDIADTSIVENPSFTYGSYGSYTVTLTVQKGSDCESSTSIEITVSELVAAADFADTVCIGSLVEFTDLSSTADGTVIDTWEWNIGDLIRSELENPSILFETSGDFDIEFIVTNSVGCTDTLNGNLYVQAAPMASAGIDTAVCVGDPSYDLEGEIFNAESGFWTGMGGVFTPSNTDLNATYFPTLDELVDGVTTLFLTTVGNGYCEAHVDTIHIRYLGTPDVIAMEDISLCNDSLFVNIEATLAFDSNTTWTSSGDGTFDDAEDLLTTYHFGPDDITNGEVILFIDTYNFSGCPNDVDSITITINTPPSMDAFVDTMVCFGFPLALDTRISTENGLWSTSGDGILDPTEGATTTYTHGALDGEGAPFLIYFESTENGGCPAIFDTLTVNIIPTPNADFDFNEACFGEETTFENNSSSTDLIVGYEWTFEPGSTSGETNPSYLFSSADMYEVELIVISENGCSDTTRKTVESHAIPFVNFEVPKPCLKGGTEFFDLSTVANDSIVSWTWDFGDLSRNDTAQNPIHIYAVDGTYDISLGVRSSFGCFNDTLISVLINLGPEARFNANPKIAHPFQDVVFTDGSIENGSPIIDWSWDFKDGDPSYLQNPTHAYDDAGEYFVELIVIDEIGCSDTAVKMVPIFHGPLIPSAFSPNGDNNNDWLMLLGANFSSVDFTIYNNWGEIVFNTQDVNSPGWDGTFKDEPQPLGVYVYVATVTTYDGEEHFLSGDVSLIR